MNKMIKQIPLNQVCMLSFERPHIVVPRRTLSNFVINDEK